jgi:hypothetical protein
MNSPTYSVDGRDVGIRSDGEPTTNMSDFNLPAGGTLQTGHSISGETSIPEGFELSPLATQGHPGPKGALNDPSFSMGMLNADLDNGDTTMTEMDELLSSEDSAEEMSRSQTREIPTNMASESLEMTSPEIKQEPISMGDIPYMDSLPSVTVNQNIVSQLVGKCVPETRGVTVLLGATSDIAPTMDVDVSTVIDRGIEINSSDMQLVPVPVSKNQGSPCMIPEDTSRSCRKRVRFDAEDERVDQQRPAKKVHQDSVAVWDVPRLKTPNLPSEDSDMSSLNVQQLPSPVESLPENTSFPLTTTQANSPFKTAVLDQFKARDVSLLTFVPPRLSRDIKQANLENSLIAKSRFIESPPSQPKIKK